MQSAQRFDDCVVLIAAEGREGEGEGEERIVLLVRRACNVGDVGSLL